MITSVLNLPDTTSALHHHHVNNKIKFHTILHMLSPNASLVIAIG